MSESEYDPLKIEQRWMGVWAEHPELNHARLDRAAEKKYVLVEFPYPSGAGLHVGHVWGYTMGDVTARYSRMNGYNVLFPMGWDAFGLPTENYAIKKHITPQEATAENVATFRTQMDAMGFSFDWQREINTSDPDYYRFTQWIFIQLFKKGLAVKEKMPINWCPKCKSGLANEEVTSDGLHERCGTPVEQKMLEQWVLKITEYADRLIKDLQTVDYTEDIKQQQINWIGRSEGAKFTFRVKDNKGEIEVFTTRPDTLPGATYIVLAPEHHLVPGITSSEQQEEVTRYISQAKTKTRLQRSDLQKDKTGVFTGTHVTNPLTGENMPIWVADYVLTDYGTGAIMAVPAHDERDFEFAKRYDLPIKPVIDPKDGVGDEERSTLLSGESCYVGEGTMINSGQFDGVDSVSARSAVVEHIGGVKTVTYKLRDWIFSRQRYWGEPIPMVYCSDCGWLPVPESDLPITLPPIDNLDPTEDGSSPLARVEEWVNTVCPSCGGTAKRETDTMPNWAGSSWYFLRYCDSKNENELASRQAMEYFMPVDLYIGGAEHTTLHLLYSRFWHKFLYDLGIVPTAEPYAKRRNRGLILASDGRKMSKSLGNVVNPLDEVDKVGADALRMYELFMGPFQESFPWNPSALKGVYRFLSRVWNINAGMQEASVEDTNEKILRKLHQTIQKVSLDIEDMKFNTAIAAMMEFINEVEGNNFAININDWSKFLLILAPFAPFVAEELWQLNAKSGSSFDSVHAQTWPTFDENLVVSSEVVIPVQVNGKFRSTITIPVSEVDLQEKILNMGRLAEGVKKHIAQGEIIREIYVKGKTINFVVRIPDDATTRENKQG
ncbi:leucine--tRNA ligase [candidate division WWE3 bacterium]|uniref:Leucine--tRNA ligase n=1 Tax=candidate division WWE3 bacterium TaxID=2053526 RepID=A0A955RQT6_UNCKA|nr:leucine--tRNA ligase [candidate division WWE3 bacterium]